MPPDIHEINRAVIEEFRANGGKVTRPGLENARLLLLTTTGAKTGRPHTTPLAYHEDGPGRVYLWASAIAAPTNPAWYHNLVANPQVTIEFPNGTHQATATTAQGPERDRLFNHLKETRPEIAAHQDRTDREIPIVIASW